MTSVFLRKRRESLERQRPTKKKVLQREMQVESGIRKLQTKECHGLPDATRHRRETWNTFFPRDFRTIPAWHFDFEPLASKTEKYKSLLLQATKFVGVCYTSSGELTQRLSVKLQGKDKIGMETKYCANKMSQ